MKRTVLTGASLLLVAATALAAEEPRGLAPEILDALLPAVAKLKAPPREGGETTRRPVGSAFLVDDRGYFLTNHHNVKDLDRAELTLSDGEKVLSESILKDEASDLALVKIPAASVRGVRALRWADESEIRVGREVFAVGAPFGLDGSVTRGIISRLFRKLELNTYEDFLQMDAAVNPGNSGGPLVTDKGEVLAVVTAIKSEHGNHSGVGFAIRGPLAKAVVEGLLADGRVKRGYLGARLRAATAAEREGTEARYALRLTEVVSGSPADKAGLRAGDLLTELDGVSIVVEERFRWQLAHRGPDRVVRLRGFRERTAFEKEVTLSSPPATPAPAAPATPPPGPTGGEPSELPAPRPATPLDLGWEIRDVTREDAVRYGHRRDSLPASVVLVTRVAPGSRAAKLAPGTLILEVERTVVRTAADAEAAIAAATRSDLLVKVLEPGQKPRFIILK